MLAVLLVGAGGFIGSVLRYGLNEGVSALSQHHWFPYGTLAVNVLGCLAIGVVTGVLETRSLLGPDSRAFLLVGLLGGFTTFSAFGIQTFALARDGQTLGALANIAASVGLGLLAVWIGIRAVEKLS